MDEALVNVVRYILFRQPRSREEGELVLDHKVKIHEVLVKDLRYEVTIASDNMDENATPSRKQEARYDNSSFRFTSSLFTNWITSRFEMPFFPSNSSNSGSGGSSST